MAYTLTDVFRPDLDSSANGLTVAAYLVSAWADGSPPSLGFTPVYSTPAYTTTTGTAYGDNGSWSIDSATNEDYYVSVSYSGTNYWRTYNAPLWSDVGGTPDAGPNSQLDVTALTIAGVSIGGIDDTDSDIQEVGTTPSALGPLGGTGLAADAAHVHSGRGMPYGGLVSTGSHAARFAGGVAAAGSGGPPGSGFAVGDFVVDTTGAMWICTATSPSVAWAELTPPTTPVVNSPGDIKLIAGSAIPSGWLACDGSAVSRVTQSALFNALKLSISATVENGSTSVTSVSPVTTGLIFNGMPVSGTDSSADVNPGTVVSAVGTSNFTLSNPYGLSAVWLAGTPGMPYTAPLVILPWGAGDGFSTFNVPDLRSRVPLGAAANVSSINLSCTVTTQGVVSVGSGGTTANLGVGMSVSGTGIPAGSQVMEILSPSQVLIYPAPTSAITTAETLAFGTATNTPAGALTYQPVGAMGGAETVLLTALQSGTTSHNHSDPGHVHGITDPEHPHNVYDPGHGHGYEVDNGPGYSYGSASGGNGSNMATAGTYGNGTGIGVDWAPTGISVNSHTTGLAPATAESATAAHPNMQPWAGLLFIIKT
jgi:microcystin-dependent protein